MPFVIDNSIVMSWCFKDESNDYADGILETLAHDSALTPAIWPLEVGNVLLVAERKGRISEAGCTRFLSLLTELPIEVEQETPDRMLREVLSLARKHNLSSYDASYLDLAMREGIPLASLDRELVKAASDCKVEICSPVQRPVSNRKD